MKFDKICESFDYAAAIDIYNGENHSLVGGDFDRVLTAVKAVFDDGFQMPALGVSIHNLTITQKSEKPWVELRFGQKCECFGMQFEGLLIFIEPDYHGCNLIRLNGDRYEGRCYYMQLSGTMRPLYDAVMSID